MPGSLPYRVLPLFTTAREAGITRGGPRQIAYRQSHARSPRESGSQPIELDGGQVFEILELIASDTYGEFHRVDGNNTTRIA